MTKDPAFLFYPGDYLQDTQCLSESTQVAYDRIMCEHMRNICISKQQLNFFTKRLTDEERNELLMMLTKKPEGYQITWVAESIEKRRLYSESRRENRKSNTKEKSKKGNNISLSYDEHMVNENEIKDENEYNKEGVPNLKEVLNYANGMAGLKLSDEGCQAYIDSRGAVGWQKNGQDIINWKADLSGFARIYKKNESANKTKAETDTVYHPKTKEYTPQEIKEIKAVQEGYERLKKEKPATRGQKLRKAVRGHDSIGETVKVKIQEVKP